MNSNIINILKTGGVGVIPTDTSYGLIGLASNKGTVERIYQLKGRAPQKPLIILISSLDDLNLFNIYLESWQQKFLKKAWPNPLSIIFNCDFPELEYLHRGTKTLAFRLPKSKTLRDLIRATKPLVAPSANPEGLPTAKNINEAKQYFGDRVEFYIDAGQLAQIPSTLIKLSHNHLEVLREGIFPLNSLEKLKSYLPNQS